MTTAQQVDAALDRAEQALCSHDVESLRWARMALMGALDHAAKAEGCEQLVRDVLRAVTAELP